MTGWPILARWFAGAVFALVVAWLPTGAMAHPGHGAHPTAMATSPVGAPAKAAVAPTAHIAEPVVMRFAGSAVVVGETPPRTEVPCTMPCCGGTGMTCCIGANIAPSPSILPLRLGLRLRFDPGAEARPGGLAAERLPEPPRPLA